MTNRFLSTVCELVRVAPGDETEPWSAGPSMTLLYCGCPRDERPEAIEVLCSLVSGCPAHMPLTISPFLRRTRLGSACCREPVFLVSRLSPAPCEQSLRRPHPAGPNLVLGPESNIFGIRGSGDRLALRGRATLISPPRKARQTERDRQTWPWATM
ncbi:hypothetical protein GQ53DRAFT_458552 [Thozetella sp. PMI_491]|nr:hypothetical protein GQ53DRAFT_458552 [Thozetella sp. PMI_491]